MTEAKVEKMRPGDGRREALVEAAAQSFWIDGYKAASLARIARRADVPVGNVYYYYKSKADIAEAVAANFVRQTNDLIEGIERDASEPRERLALLVSRLRDSQASRVRFGCPIHAAIRGFRGDAPEASKLAARSFEMLADFIGGEFKRSGTRPSVANLQARACVATWQGGIALAYALQEPPALAEAFHRMEQLMGIRAPK